MLKRLSEGEVYFTMDCRERWTAKAKENIAWEIECLRTGEEAVSS